MPKVSVVIPTFNRVNFILQAIESVTRQSYKDLEIIVADDGSKDETRQVIEHLYEAGTIRYFWQPNQGEAAARNLGIENSTGKYIAFLDSDDLFLGESLLRQIAVLEANPDIGLVHGDFEKFTGDGISLGRRDTSWFQGSIYPDILCHWSGLMATCTVMVPAKIFHQVGLFGSGLTRGSDLDMWRRISRLYRFAYIPDILARVRVHMGNISGDRSNESEVFAHILHRAFTDDPQLSSSFCRRSLGQMYATTGLNLLCDHGQPIMKEARSRFLKALQNEPFGWKAYAGWIISYLPLQFRQKLGQQWRRRKYPIKRSPDS